MEYTEDIREEVKHIYGGDFQMGEHIYMGMGKLNGRTVCLSVAYKIDYCFKKATQFVEEDNNLRFSHINKVRVGETSPCCRFDIDEVVLNN